MTDQPLPPTPAAPTPADPAPGAPRVVGDRYQLEGLLGRGGMADVHRAHDLVLDRPVAVKLLREAAGDATDRARFTSEARTLAMLSHPALVTVLDAGVAVEQPFLVMELVDGVTLSEVVRRGTLPPARAAGIASQVAGALAFAHDAGVVHRDVKPANVLVAEGDRVKLADFGIARLVGDTVRHTRTGTAIGTAAYLSPEQVRGEDVTGAADVYSLGLVLLEVLTGRQAFSGSHTEAALARLSRDPDVPAGLPPGWVELLRAMTARDPGARPAAGEVAQRLRSLAAGPLPRSPRWPRSPRAPHADGPTTTRVLPATAARNGARAVIQRWHAIPSHLRGAAAALAALLLLLLVVALAGRGGEDGEEVGPVPADTPADYREPLQDLHDAVGGS